jgi:predicted dehydrogenase
MTSFLAHADAQVVAVCDVDKAHRDQAQVLVEKQYAADRQAGSFKGCDTYNDFRDLLAREDIDAVSIGTPDHWHSIPVILAAQAGKDIYCEKPLSYSIDEGKAMVATVQRYNRVFQTGTWRRSRSACRLACELVRNGRIGELKTIRCYVPAGYQIRDGDYGDPAEQPVPEGFDYDLWLGPAPYAPYTAGRCHFNFRWIQDYAEGYISDWGAHYLDVGQWGNGTDLTGPVSAEGWGKYPESGLYDAAIAHHVEFTFKNGVKMISATSEGEEGKTYGIWFDGTEGQIYVESGEVKSTPESIASSPIGPGDIRLYDSTDHHGNFLECIRSRGKTAAPVESAHRSATICHLASIVSLLGRGVQWDPDKEEFIDDPETARFMYRTMRGTWHI